ncbi:MAG: urease accessory protein UreD [Pseudomonadota bacterium]
MTPACHGQSPEAVFLNTAGGLTGGDRFTFSASVEDGALFLTTQTAERAYACADARAAEVKITLRAGPGATLYWLPQETILFNESALDRRTLIDCAPGATVVALEMLVFGRAAMGETLERFSLRDRRDIMRAGAPAWVDALALDEGLIGHPAGLGSARAIATLAYMGDEAQAVCHRLASEPDVCVSAWEGKCILRAASHDLWPLKKAMARAIKTMTGGTLPRVWAV